MLIQKLGPRSFLDTNVLVYAVSSAEHEAAKSRKALELSLRFGISYRDAAILAAAEALEARVVYTEDLSHGQRYGTVRAVNPFLEA